MSDLLTVSFAVAFTYAALEPLISLIHIYVSNKLFNFIFWTGMSALGLYTLDGLDNTAWVTVLATAFLSRASYAALERVTTYRRTIVKSTD